MKQQEIQRLADHVFAKDQQQILLNVLQLWKQQHCQVFHQQRVICRQQ